MPVCDCAGWSPRYVHVIVAALVAVLLELNSAWLRLVWPVDRPSGSWIWAMESIPCQMEGDPVGVAKVWRSALHETGLGQSGRKEPCQRVGCHCSAEKGAQDCLVLPSTGHTKRSNALLFQL